jgi:hypothetical protein
MATATRKPAPAAKKAAAKKSATPPEPVELTFTLNKTTAGTYCFEEEEAEDGTVIQGKAYLKKFYFGDFVPDENTVVTVTIQVDQLQPE